MKKLDLAAVRQFVLRVDFIPIAVLSLIGLAVLATVGYIVAGVVRNGGLIPPPSRMLAYECKAPNQTFTLHYLHGADRVLMRSAVGVLEGTVRQGRLDWKGFDTDRAMLGFIPPSDLIEQDNGGLQLKGGEVVDAACVRSASEAPAPAKP